MPLWVQWVSFALAIIGSASGLFALYLNHERTTIARRKENERLEAKKKAVFTVNRTKQVGSKRMQDRFLLNNNGQAEARNIEVHFYNYDWNKDRREINPLGGEKVPSKINPGHTINMQMVIYKGTAPPYEIVITWDDDFQSGNRLETTLN